MKKIIGIFILMLLIVTTLPTIGMINEYQSINYVTFSDCEYISGEFIVKFNDIPTSYLSVENLDEKYQVLSVDKVFKNVEDTNLENIYKYKVSMDSDILSIVEEYNSLPNVVYAEPNYILQTFNIPNDEFFPIQWSLDNTGQLIYEDISGTSNTDINAPEAWDIETGSEDVIIAVIDTGVDYNHPDLVDNLWTNEDEISDNDVDDDNNGYVDDYYGYDLNNSDSDPLDDSGHGTICSGLIGAQANNNIGISGVCWDCKIMNLKAGNHKSQIILNMAAEGIKYAVDNGADILSLSFGGKNIYDTLKDAIQYAHEKGVIIVAAAGNSNEETIMYPAGYDNVIAVGATDHNDERCTEDDWDPNHKMPGNQGSQFGYWIDVAAPGHLIFTTLPTYEVTRNNMEHLQIGGYYPQNYWYLAGTSVSGPIVAGLAGLILSNKPELTNDEVRRIIRANVDPYISDEYIGTGRINAYKALMELNTQPEIPNTPTGKTNGRPGREYSFTTSAIDEDGDELWYFWDWGDGNYSEWLGPYASSEECEASYTWQQEANFSIKVKVKDGKGGESYWSEEFIFSTPKNIKITSSDVFWSDDFDSYETGQILDGGSDDGGWEIWDDGVNNPRPAGGEVIDYISRSPPHSVEIFLSVDILHQFTGLNSGNLTCRIWTYVPNETKYGAILVFASYYIPGNIPLQRVPFALQSDNVEQYIFNTFNHEQFLPLITDQWVEIRLELNIDDDWCECYYNNELLLEGVWSEIGTGDGYRNFAFIDLYFGQSPVYFDDLSIEWESNGLETDLEGEGSFNWVDVETESVVFDNFTLENVGDSGSWLEWKVVEYPDFGQWYCEPNKGTLKQEDGPITLEVRVKAPEGKNKEFTGDLKIQVIGNPNDEVIIPVTLTTPKSKTLNGFNPWILRLIQHFPILESLLSEYS